MVYHNMINLINIIIFKLKKLFNHDDEREFDDDDEREFVRLASKRAFTQEEDEEDDWF